MEFEKYEKKEKLEITGFIEKGKQFDLDITLPEDNRNVIYGVIKDYNYKTNYLEVEGISNTESVSVGDYVYTSGLGGVFPSGILIGKVSEITTDEYNEVIERAEEIIEELVSLILMQEEEINDLKNKINRINQYIDTYEEYIKGE